VTTNPIQILNGKSNSEYKILFKKELIHYEAFEPDFEKYC
jgi:hypothetical protein